MEVIDLIRREALERIIILATKALQADSEACAIDKIMDTKDATDDEHLRKMFDDAFDRLCYYDSAIQMAVKDEYKAP